MAAEKQMSFGTKQLNLDKPKITKALSVDDSSHLRLTKPLDVSSTSPVLIPMSFHRPFDFSRAFLKVCGHLGLELRLGKMD